MGTESDKTKNITKLVTDALAVLVSIQNSPASTSDEKKAAQDAYEDLLLMLGRAAIDSYEGRTAALTGLVAELNDVTKKIQIANPATKFLDPLLKISDSALALFKKEKEEKKTDGAS